jgi:hypothetical protein
MIAQDPLDAVVLLILLLALLSAARLLFAWWDMRNLRKKEEVEDMVWPRMR